MKFKKARNRNVWTITTDISGRKIGEIFPLESGQLAFLPYSTGAGYNTGNMMEIFKFMQEKEKWKEESDAKE